MVRLIGPFPGRLVAPRIDRHADMIRKPNRVKAVSFGLLGDGDGTHLLERRVVQIESCPIPRRQPMGIAIKTYFQTSYPLLASFENIYSP